MTARGTRFELDNGQLARVIDRTGCEWARLAWDGPRLVSLEVPGVGGVGVVRVLGVVVRDELLGEAHDIVASDNVASLDDIVATDRARHTRMSAIDWARPTEIPAIAAPNRLPPGSGGTILNTIAMLAQRAGVAALRYAGPYPTSALWRTLARSFRTDGTEQAFTANLVERMACLARDPIAIDFAPAPFEQVALIDAEKDRGFVELRDGVQRVVLDGIAYERGGSPARLVGDRPTRDDDSARCDAEARDARITAELWFGDTRYARIATLSTDGSLLDGPHPIPPCASDVIGKPFPAALTAALAELVAEAVPAPLARDARGWLASREIRWADLGGRVARVGDRVEVHAALWQHVGPHGLGRLALALAEALAPVVTNAVIAEIMARATLPA